MAVPRSIKLKMKKEK